MSYSDAVKRSFESDSDSSMLKPSNKKMAANKLHSDQPTNFENLSEKELLVVLVKDVKDIRDEQHKLRSDFITSLTAMRSDLSTEFTGKIDQVKEDLTKEVDGVNKKIEDLELKFAELESKQGIKTPLDNIDLCIIAQNVYMAPNEDPLYTANAILNAMGTGDNGGYVCENVNILSAKRLPNNSPKSPALLKFALSSLQEKKYVLLHKASLRNHDSYKNVYLRSSKTHLERNLEQNCRIILHNSGWGKDYRLSANGKLLQKRPPQSQDYRQQKRRDGPSSDIRQSGNSGEIRNTDNVNMNQVMHDMAMQTKLSDLSSVHQPSSSTPIPPYHAPGAMGGTVSEIRHDWVLPGNHNNTPSSHHMPIYNQDVYQRYTSSQGVHRSQFVGEHQRV